MKSIPNNDEHAQGYSCPGAIFAFCAYGESYLARLVTQCCTTGNPPREAGSGPRRTLSNRPQTADPDKVDPGVTDLPRVHVNMP